MNEATIRQIAEETLETRMFTRKGIVTSYDPATHKAKVQIQPENLETGWLQAPSLMIGQEYGMSVGLEPGTEVLVHFENGDLNAGVIGAAYYSNEAPYPAKPGAVMITHKSGSYVRLFNDGRVEIAANEQLVLMGEDGILISTPGTLITNAGITQSFVTGSIPGAPNFNPALHVEHEETA